MGDVPGPTRETGPAGCHVGRNGEWLIEAPITYREWYVYINRQQTGRASRGAGGHKGALREGETDGGAYLAQP